MNSDIKLNIVIRSSNIDRAAYYAADAVEIIMYKYFVLQVVDVKRHILDEKITDHIKKTTKWLASNSCKNIIMVQNEVWDKIINDFISGKDFFLIKDDYVNLNTALVFWPNNEDYLSKYI